MDEWVWGRYRNMRLGRMSECIFEWMNGWAGVWNDGEAESIILRHEPKNSIFARVFWHYLFQC